MKTRKRMLSFFLVFCMLLTCMPDTLVYAEGEATGTKFSGGSGTEGDPYLLKNAKDFIQLATDVKGGNRYESTYFKVADDVTEPIKLSSADGFEPIGIETYYFKGKFDGNGKTVDLDLYLPDVKYVGLFGAINELSVVKNVTTTGKVTGKQYVGGIVGHGTGCIVNCHN